MRRMSQFSCTAIALALAACSGGDDDRDSSGDNGDGPPTYPSTFTEGKYRVTGLQLLGEGEGEDFDGDGVPDNNLPRALEAADLLLRDIDLAPESFNAEIASSIVSGEFNLLLDLRYEGGELRVDLFSALPSAPGEPLVIDPASLDAQGQPLTRLYGEFTEQRAMSARAEVAVLPVPFIPGEPVSLVPVRRMGLRGDAEVDVAVVGMVTGLIPAERLADDVLADLIPEEGIGNLSREQLLRTLRTFANLESIADIELGPDERAVSCAFSLRAAPADF